MDRSEGLGVQTRLAPLKSVTFLVILLAMLSISKHYSVLKKVEKKLKKVVDYLLCICYNGGVPEG